MWWCRPLPGEPERRGRGEQLDTEIGRDGDTVKGIYSRILSFMICFFTKGFFPYGPNSSPRLRFTASPRRCATITVWIIISLAAAGCGYHFAGTGGQAPGDIKSIAVDVLQNNTAEIGLGNVFTNAIINQFVRWKKLPIKPRKEADGVLGGSIADIQFQEVSHVDSKKTLTTRVTITLKLTLKRVETDEILWKRNYSYYEDYVETGNALDTALLRRRAATQIAEYLAEKIYMDMFEEF
jgi:hypothetical protein